MARKRSSQSASTLIPELARVKFDQKLVLHQWMLSLFDGRSFEQLAEPLKPAELEGLDEDNNHKFLKQIRLLWEFDAFPGDILLGYDQNIVKHTLKLNERRPDPIRWKYFQWLSLLFTEVYLDRFFRHPQRLLTDLNQFVEKFNADKLEKDRIPPYQPGDLRKIAFWNATGSGKTLLMHVNIFQYQHYLALEGRGRELNRIILLTPNEGLSKQHLVEFKTAGMPAELFTKDDASLFAGRTIEIIDIHKLREDTGEKTVAIDAFEGKNLVLVDEGHRGSSGKETGRWMDARRRLCEDGFSFEYSATFGQAMKASGNRELEKEYAKCILFDYSYKYFYRDGFGKDYRILNLADDSDEDKRRLYLTACLLAFYQQQRLYRDKVAEFRPFLLESPLWVFVGGTVLKKKTKPSRADEATVSDVVDILLFLAEFVKDKRDTIKLLDRLMSGKPGLHDQRGNEIFATAFGYLKQTGRDGEDLFTDILQTLFNAPVPAKLHVLNLKGTDGEIALRLGENEAFGLIYVGDASALCKLCDEHPDDMTVNEKEFSGSLFDNLRDADSTVNVLIGSKKFTEGWNSWRVSTMGLMNVGKSEGSEIIQLFGRGVRLRGFGGCLKRSSQIDGVPKPPHVNLLETLNIFGIRAQYMQQFKEYLEDEGLPSNEDRIEFILPVVKNLDGRKLKSIRLEEGTDFKRNGPKPTLDEPRDTMLRHRVALNWYPKIQSRQSKGVTPTSDIAVMETGEFEDKHLAFMDIDAIWFELQHFKNERSWHNLNLPRESIMKLLANPDWYRLYIPAVEMKFTRFDRVRRWEEIAVALLKKYIDRYYKYRKQEWEADHLEYHEFREDDPNFVQEYRLLIDQSAEAIKTSLEALRDEINKKTFRKDWLFGNLSAYWFGNHLYQPLLHLSKSQLIEISPVTLNEGERDFVLDLRTFYDGNKDYFKERELFLLRNVSKRGIGFFEAGNFYPDFILWLLVRKKQYVTFVDPKGLRQLDDGSSNPKVQFYRTIKEIEARLADPSVVLNSFVLSTTPYQNIPMWGEGMTKTKLRECHVLFQRDDKESYIGMMLDGIQSAIPGIYE
ncbi:MAG: DEAD/DEAH box helicase family protein [Planctomycetota bacterium]|mgnify:CR=1 FL=1